MAISATKRQELLKEFSQLKDRTEKISRGDQALVQTFRQKLHQPAPLASNPVLQLQLDKAYAVCQKIIPDIIGIYQAMDGICQNRIAFLDHLIDTMRTSETNVDLNKVSEALISFDSLLKPITAQSMQLQRTLQVEEAAMLMLLAKAGESLPIETNEPLLVYPEGLRRRICHRLKV